MEEGLFPYFTVHYHSISSSPSLTMDKQHDLSESDQIKVLSDATVTSPSTSSNTSAGQHDKQKLFQQPSTLSDQPPRTPTSRGRGYRSVRFAKSVISPAHRAPLRPSTPLPRQLKSDLEDQQTIEYFSYRSGYKSGREQQEPSVAPKSLRTASEDYDQSVLCTAWESGDEQCSSSKKSKLEHVSIEPIFNITPSSENDYYDEALQYESISPSPSSEKLSGAPDDACSTSTISLSTLGQTNSATSRSLLRTPTSSTTRPAIVTPLRPLSLNGPRTYSPLACITTSPGISFLRTPTSVGQASKAPNRYSEPSRDSSAASRHTRPSMLRFSYGDSHSTRSLVSPQPPPELNTTGIRSEEPKLTSSREGNREEEGANQAESAGDGKQKNTFLSTFSSAEILIQSEYKAEIVDYGDEEINDTNEGTTSENEKEEGVRPLAPAYDEHLGQKCAIQAVITGKSTEGACDIKQDESTVDDKGNKRPSSPPSSWWLVEQDEIDYNSDKENIDPRQYQRSDHSGCILQTPSRHRSMSYTAPQFIHSRAWSSPTDSMRSPCSQVLTNNRSRSRALSRSWSSKERRQ